MISQKFRNWYYDNNIGPIIYVVLIVPLLYFFIASLVYAFRHPEMTDTQRLLHFWDVVTFRRSY